MATTISGIWLFISTSCLSISIPFRVETQLPMSPNVPLWWNITPEIHIQAISEPYNMDFKKEDRLDSDSSLKDRNFFQLPPGQ
jgi:hypothetical protein